MGRTKFREFKLPDAINRCTDKNGFTQISNSFIRDPKISITAKMILILSLSNNDGWTSHINKISEILNRSEKTIKSALTELEQLKYLIRIQFRDKKTKKRKGSFWTYTDVANNFSYQKNLNILTNQGYETINKKLEGKIYPMVKDNTELPDNHLEGKKLEGGFLPANNTIKERKNTMKEFADAIPSKEDNNIVTKEKVTNPCPYNFIFGKDHQRYAGCEECEEEDHKIWYKCKMFKKNSTPKATCSHGYRFGIDNEEHPVCDRCEVKKECYQKRIALSHQSKK